MTVNQAQYNAEVFRKKSGLSSWRTLYSRIIPMISGIESVIEYGAGDPLLLDSLPNTLERRAVDGTDVYRETFTNCGIALDVHDLDKPGYSAPRKYDVAICSDVFEHLISPAVALELIEQNLNEEGVLFAHVPNEFTFPKILKIMLGKSENIFNHAHCEEWNHPHLHRFTDVGFRKFLSLRFKYLVKIADLQQKRTVMMARKAGISLPYCMEGGPTYIATNSAKRAAELEKIKASM